MIHGMGANKTEMSIRRIGKSIGPIKMILDSFNENNGVSRGSGTTSLQNVREIKPPLSGS